MSSPPRLDHPFFSRLLPDELAFVSQAVQVLPFAANQRVVQAGNPSQGMFILASGTALLLNAANRPVQALEIGGVYNDGALWQEDSEPYSLDTQQASVCWFLSRQRMQVIVARYPTIRERLGTPAPMPPAISAAPVAAPQPIEPSASPARQAPKPQQAPSSTSEQRRSALQHAGESVLLVKRRHWWVFVRQGWQAILLMLLFLVGGVFAANLSMLLAVLLVIAGVGLPVGLMAYHYFEWRNDSVMVTDQRVIQVERNILTFSVRINEMPLENVQEVNTDLPTGDLFARIFDYGTVTLKNAAANGDMILDMVPNPDAIQEAIFANQSKRRELAAASKQSAMRAEIAGLLGLSSATQAEPNAVQRPVDDIPERQGFALARMRYTDDNGDTVIRKHVTVWLGAVIPPLLVILGSVVIAAVTLIAPNWLRIGGLPLAALILVLGGLWLWWADWDWRNDLYIIGDTKITLIHRRPLWLQNEVEQVLMSRIDNVVSETSGLLDTLFQRGDVRLSLIGETKEEAKVFHKVHRPQEIQAEISQRQASARQNAESADDERQRQAISDYLKVYHEVVASQNPVATPPPQPAVGKKDPLVQPAESPDHLRPKRIPQRKIP